MILSIRVSTSKNENIDHQDKETSTMISKQVTYETDKISLPCDSTLSSALNFCFLCTFMKSKRIKIILEKI